MNHELDVTDGVTTNDKAGGNAVSVPGRVKCIVVNPIFKNGTEYQPGQDIELDSQTAKNFILSGDLKEA